MTDLAKLVLAADSTQIVSASRDLRDLEKSAARAEGAADSLDKKFAGFIGFAAVSASIMAVANAHREYSAAVSDLSAITGAVGDDLQYYNEQARLIGSTTTLSASQAVEAFKLIASAKPDLLESKEALASVTKEVVSLAEASGLDMGTAANALGSALNQFGADAEEASRYVNVLAAGAKFGASEISDTAEALKAAGTTAAVVGLSFEETNAAIQAMANVALKGSQAGTGLKSVLLKLAQQSRDEFNPEIVGLEAALKNLAAAHLTTAEKADLFGLESIAAGNALMKEAGNIGELIKKLTGTNTAYEQASVRVDNLDGDIKRLLSTVESVSLSIGEEFDPSLRSLVQSMNEFISSLRDSGSINDFIEIMTLLAKIISVIVAAKLVAWLVAVSVQMAINIQQTIMYQAALARMAGASLAAGAAMGGMRTILAMLGGPVGLLALGAIGLAAWAASSRDAVVATKDYRGEIAALTKDQKEMETARITARIKELNIEMEALREAAQGRVGFFDVVLGSGRERKDAQQQLNEANRLMIALKNQLKEVETSAKPAAVEIANVGRSTMAVEEASRKRAEAEKDLIEDIFRDDTARSKYLADMAMIQEMYREGKLSTEKYAEAMKVLAERYNSIGESGTDVMDDLKNATAGWASNFSSALNDAAWNADVSFGKIFESFARMLTQMMIQKQLVEPMLLSMGIGTKQAMGGAWEDGVQKFATGAAFTNSVVSRPTLFATSSGLGVMGEEDPEAIMPLDRTSDGKLGVSAKGMGGNVQVNVYNNAAGTKATATKSRGSNGEFQIDVLVETVESRLSRNISRGEGLATVIESQYGLSRV